MIVLSLAVDSSVKESLDRFIVHPFLPALVHQNLVPLLRSRIFPPSLVSSSSAGRCIPPSCFSILKSKTPYFSDPSIESTVEFPWNRPTVYKCFPWWPCLFKNATLNCCLFRIIKDLLSRYSIHWLGVSLLCGQVSPTIFDVAPLWHSV